MGEEYKLIGLCIDKSKHATRAFEYYVKSIHRQGFKLALIHAHVAPPMPSTPMYPGAMNVNVEWAEELNQSVTESRNLISGYKKKCQEHGIPCVAYAESDRGSAGETIARLVEENNIYMVVLGSRGLGTVRRTFLGSVSDYLVHHLHCPVTVVPPS